MAVLTTSEAEFAAEELFDWLMQEASRLIEEHKRAVWRDDFRANFRPMGASTTSLANGVVSVIHVPKSLKGLFLIERRERSGTWSPFVSFDFSQADWDHRPRWQIIICWEHTPALLRPSFRDDLRDLCSRMFGCTQIMYHVTR